MVPTPRAARVGLSGHLALHRRPYTASPRASPPPAQPQSHRETMGLLQISAAYGFHRWQTPEEPLAPAGVTVTQGNSNRKGPVTAGGWRTPWSQGAGVRLQLWGFAARSCAPRGEADAQGASGPGRAALGTGRGTGPRRGCSQVPTHSCFWRVTGVLPGPSLAIDGPGGLRPRQRRRAMPPQPDGGRPEERVSRP